MEPMEQIPLTLITGFLGSGKTTIIKNLLKQKELKNTAVIINEFGDIGLDNHFIETSNEDLVELSTGCLCCVMRGDLQEAIARLLRKRLDGFLFDRIILETTGMADPAPIIQSLVLDKTSSPKVILDRVLVTVDSMTGLTSLTEFEEASRQVALADILLITKTDLLTDDTVNLKRVLKAINEEAKIFTSNLGQIDLALVLDKRDNWTNNYVSKSEDEHFHSHSNISSVSLYFKKPIHAVTLTLFLEVLAETLGSNLIRIKGLVFIKEAKETPAIVHGVQHVFHAISWHESWPERREETQLVFIGRDLSLQWIKALLITIEEEVDEMTRHSDQ
ncbi:GTP-binding protein [Alphaproteobacteria bacterium]|nr:GTP-binding protein [Alphaproteobacteria bacterium]